jgi:hypothetical protein
MRIWISATCLSKSRAMSDWPSNFRQCIFVSFRFDAASAMVSAPASPQRAAQIPLRIDRIVTGNCSGARRLPGLGILARWDHRMGISGGNRLVAFTGVIRPVCGDIADVLVRGDLVQKFWQHGSIHCPAAHAWIAFTNLQKPHRF